jgi:hypothetical protein
MATGTGGNLEGGIDSQAIAWGRRRGEVQLFISTHCSVTLRDFISGAHEHHVSNRTLHHELLDPGLARQERCKIASDSSADRSE